MIDTPDRGPKQVTAAEIDPLPLIDPERKLVLITNAKCGGTSLKDGFFKMLDLPVSPLKALSLARRLSPGFAWDFHIGTGARRYRSLAAGQAVGEFTGFYVRRISRPLLDAARGPDWRKIAVVRDPFARSVSAFLEKFCTDNRNRPWVAEVTAAAGHDGTITYRQFVHYLATTDNSTVNRHWRRQTYVIDFFGEVEMVRLEHLAEDIAALDPPLPAALQEPPARNVSPYAAGAPWVESGTAAADIDNVTLLELRARREPTPRPEDFLAPELRDSLQRVYARDFERLPYE
ncbi:sulfotransferase family 2 domain-containing protein [Tropicimonas sediminicola]|uniref:Sulfotransferase family protein n=1 Tax=Tropicimonas sediminicola TaxID=1031541 RepID=A0A239CJ80_9RHOB|nr:sulfotransferase family 2 domain-containing protein [Tropicimonas sediminicola]SNS19413.1 Sulfotransferase family protein [Tropicimonas sediminicola]